MTCCSRTRAAGLRDFLVDSSAKLGLAARGREQNEVLEFPPLDSRALEAAAAATPTRPYALGPAGLNCLSSAHRSMRPSNTAEPFST